MANTVSLQRAWEINLKTYEAFGLSEEQTKVFYGYLIFLFGIWILGWVITIAVVKIKIHLFKKKNQEIAPIPFVIKWYKHSYLKWYWKTKLNWVCVALLIVLGTISFGNWWGI